MANHNSSGGRDAAFPEDNQSSWRPQDNGPREQLRGNDDRDYRSWPGRDLRDRRGQGQSGYSAGRHAEDRSQRRHGETIPSAGSFEDRHHDLGVDDRFTGRGRAGYWQDRTGYETGHEIGHEIDRPSIHGSYRGRDFEPERTDLAGKSRGRDERLGYPAGSYGHGYGGSSVEDTGRHVHRGSGPHRGKGPMGYQRSDERTRELVCESLADDDELDASQIEVAVTGGEVTLSGTVDDRRAKRHAEDCACSVSSVRDVQNRLRVRAEPSSMQGNPGIRPSVGRCETDAAAHDKKHR